MCHLVVSEFYSQPFTECHIISLEWYGPHYVRDVSRYICTFESGDDHGTLTNGVVSPAVPFWMCSSGEEFEFVLGWVHPIDSFDKSGWFSRMTLSFFLIELSFISSSARFRDSTFYSDDTDFDGGHGVVSWVGDKFFPDKADGFVFEAPRFEDINGYIELWSSGPHIADAVFCSEVIDIHSAEFIWFHSWVVVRGRSGVIGFFVSEGTLIVVPRWVAVDNFVLLWWFVSVFELFFCVW